MDHLPKTESELADEAAMDRCLCRFSDHHHKRELNREYDVDCQRRDCRDERTWDERSPRV